MQPVNRTTATETNGHEPTVAHLTSGIVSDIGQLLNQQVELLRTDLATNMSRTREAAILFAIGYGALGVAGMALVYALGFGLNALYPDLPVWACFAYLCGFLFLFGGVFIYASRQKWHSVHSFSEESAHVLKENLQCLNLMRKL